MPVRDIVVIGASAGGVETLTRLVRALPANLPAALFVVIHFPQNGVSLLPDILNRNGPLRAIHPQHGENFHTGQIYVAPPNWHMQIRDGKILLDRSARVNNVRPSIDTLFRSAARNFGERVLGVILSGTLGDGVAGLQAIKLAGGVAIVQDPQDAPFSGLPANALEKADVDYVLAQPEIAATIAHLAQGDGGGVNPAPARKKTGRTGKEMQKMDEETENSQIQSDIKRFEKGEMGSTHTVLTCPDCGGVLWELHNGRLIHYRCHVGHVYSPESLIMAHNSEVESALWSAARSLEERAALLRRLASASITRGHLLSAKRFVKSADDAEKNANILRSLLLAGSTLNDEQLFSDELDGEIDNPSTGMDVPSLPQ